MSFTFYLALTLTNIRNQVARPTSRVSVPASQLAKQPASRQAGQNLSQLKAQPASQPTKQPAGQRKKKSFFFDFSRFLRGKGMPKQKKHTCVRAEKEKKIFFLDFSRFSRGKGMQKKNVQHMRSGRERKKENFSIFLFFPALSAKGVHRTKTTLLIQHSIYIYINIRNQPYTLWILWQSIYGLLENHLYTIYKWGIFQQGNPILIHQKGIFWPFVVIKTHNPNPMYR